MRAGNLDRVIEIETNTPVIDPGSGEHVPAWSPLATMRAQIVEQSTEEFFKAGGILSDDTVVFRTRYVVGVTTMSRILYAGRYYNIGQIKEIGRRQGLELRAAAGEYALVGMHSLDFSDPANSMYLALLF